MKYPGGKNCAGTYQRIINQIPPHATYIEPFVGSGAVLRLKRPAERSIALDLEPGAIAALRDAGPPATEYIEANAIDWLAKHHFDGTEFVYCDPPYLPEACRSRIRYRFKMTREDHERLLRVLLGLPCRVMISGYWSNLYAEMLAGWRTDSFPQITRGGYSIDEWLWMNYPAPVALHDYRFLGANYRDRERLSRKKKRWTRKLAAMAPLERQMILAALEEIGLRSTIAATGDASSFAGVGRQRRR